MEKLKEVLNKAMGSVIEKKNELELEISRIEKRNEKLNKVEQAQSEKVKYIAAREKEIKKIDDILKVKEEAVKLNKKANEGLKNLENAKISFEKEKKVYGENKQAIEAELKDTKDRYDRELKALKKSKDEYNKKLVNIKKI